MRANHRKLRRRLGFTLIELLVVIAIISILISLSAFGVFSLIGSQQSANTKSELNRLQLELQKQYKVAADQFAAEPIPASGTLNTVYYNVVLPMANNNPNLARVIWVMLRLKQTFPQNFNEALQPTPMPALTSYSQQLAALGYTVANTTKTQPWESSVLLLKALQRGGEGGGVKIEDLGVTSFIHDFGPTPNGQTVKGLIDGWSNPLRFCRWPTNSTFLNPGGLPQLGDNNDSGDASGLLESASWQISGSPAGKNLALFLQYCHPVGQPPKPAAVPPKDATSYRIFPLVVSAGPDGFLGLDKEPFQLPLTNPPQLSPAPPLSYYFGALAANQGGTFAADDLYPTLAPR
jgi:prepilin-type N-terminal cleavage/methylation domain-containing protein